MERETGLGVNLENRVSRSRRRFVAGAALTAVGAVGAAMDAAGARKRKKKPATRTITRTYVNDGQIRIPAGVNSSGAANPYPSSITVADLNGAVVRSVTVALKGVFHSSGREIVAMLAKDTINAILIGAAGGFEVIDEATIILDDTAENALPQSTAVVSGRFQPTNYIDLAFLPNNFKPPAPLPSGNALLSAFRAVDPNGSWRLYAGDRVIGSDGGISGGWELTITADVPTTRKKKKKKR